MKRKLEPQIALRQRKMTTQELERFWSTVIYKQTRPATPA
jgi:hypothetical protein